MPNLGSTVITGAVNAGLFGYMLEEFEYMTEECGYMLEECDYMLERCGFILQPHGLWSGTNGLNSRNPFPLYFGEIFVYLIEFNGFYTDL